MLQVAHNAESAQKRSFGNSPEGRQRMMEFLAGRSRECAGAQIVLAYEAGPHGFGLHDELTAAKIRAHVLAPTLLPQSVKGRKDKTDEKDALRILEALRGHFLAGNRLPPVWGPDKATRDDREVVRSRLMLTKVLSPTCRFARTIPVFPHLTLRCRKYALRCEKLLQVRL